MKAVRWLAIALGVYVGIVVLFESAIGYFQPANASTLTITTIDPDGSAHDRVLARIESGGKLYVAANHWPRAWFDRAKANPEVRVTMDGKTGDYTAVEVGEAEHASVNSEHALPLPFRFLTGFPPRYFLRLDPRS